jgi:hypothetical protein
LTTKKHPPMIQKKKIAIEYNLPQFAFTLSKAPIRVLEWGRGTGKSTILGRYIRDCVEQMPRSTGVLVASSFAQIKTRTLPSTISGLEQHGLYKDLHYYVGQRPPKWAKWPEPHEPPLDYKNCIIFWNGTVLNFLSQDSSGSSGRGLNIDWGLADEAALLDEKKFQTDFVLSMRGGKKKIAAYPDGNWKYYKDCALHHSYVLATSTPITLSGRWIFKYEEQSIMDPAAVTYIKASSLTNKKNLSQAFFDNAKATLPDFIYNAEILNIRLPKIENGFYPLLSDTCHCYNDFNALDIMSGSTRDCSKDEDIITTDPLIAGIDWGTAINCMVIAQGNTSTMNFLNNIYVKYPKIVDDLVDEFLRYYEPHQRKELYLWYDPTGNINTANSRTTLAEQVRERLQKGGWKVYLMTTGRNNELHENKYHLWNNILKEEEGSTFPIFRMNGSNCKELWISMSNAPAKIGMNESIRKDKSSEGKKSVKQEHATHFSDAGDVIIVGMYRDLLFGKRQRTGLKARLM